MSLARFFENWSLSLAARLVMLHASREIRHASGTHILVCPHADPAVHMRDGRWQENIIIRLRHRNTNGKPCFCVQACYSKNRTDWRLTNHIARGRQTAESTYNLCLPRMKEDTKLHPGCTAAIKIGTDVCNSGSRANCDWLCSVAKTRKTLGLIAGEVSPAMIWLKAVISFPFEPGVFRLLWLTAL